MVLQAFSYDSFAAAVCAVPTLCARPASAFSGARPDVLLIDRAKAPVLVFASPFQLALNLFDFGHVGCRYRRFASENDEQHVNERIRRDVYQFSMHRASPWSELSSDRHLGMCNPAARDEHVRTDEKSLQISEPDQSMARPACRDLGSDAMRAGGRSGNEEGFHRHGYVNFKAS
jgi:hypothetical protein